MLDPYMVALKLFFLSNNLPWHGKYVLNEANMKIGGNCISMKGREYHPLRYLKKRSIVDYCNSFDPKLQLKLQFMKS